MPSIDTTVALLSIHSEFADAILEGRKTVEFRKTRFSKPVKYVLLYSTMPVGNIVGLIELKEIHQSTPQKIWKSFGASGSISKKRFFEYYANTETSVALEIKQAWSFGENLNLSDLGIDRAPQSFVYATVNNMDALGKRRKVRVLKAA